MLQVKNLSKQFDGNYVLKNVDITIRDGEVYGLIGANGSGKSTLINRLHGGAIAKVGDRPGVTRANQWVRVGDYLELLDTPGIIPTRQDDQVQATKLAFVNSVSENAYSHEHVAIALLDMLGSKYNDFIKTYYKADELTLEAIAKSRNWILKGTTPDVERTAKYVLKDFREGRLGKFVLDDLPQN